MSNAVGSPDRRVTALERFQALADEKRLRVLETLAGGERCVCDLQDSLEVGQSLLSHHLKTLKDAGLVEARREGRWMYYSVCCGALEEVVELAGALARACRSSDAGGCC